MRTTLAAFGALCLTLLVLSGCGPKPQPPAPAALAADASLGESIFTTGIGASGQHVPFEKGSTMFKAKPG